MLAAFATVTSGACAQSVNSQGFSFVALARSSSAALYPDPIPGTALTRPAVESPPPQIHPFSRVGIAARVGVAGIGFDVATPVAARFNLRAGADFFTYTDNFTDQGATVYASLQLRSGHGALDWFPFGNGFRISPMVNFANNNHVRAGALIPGGSTVSLNGANYISNPTDPLHGTGTADFRKISPGLTVGYGNIIPRTGKHLSFPVELGFIYVAQASVKVTFTGSACDPRIPIKYRCGEAEDNPSFMQSLAAFTARNIHNFSYVDFYPVFSTGVGYSF